MSNLLPEISNIAPEKGNYYVLPSIIGNIEQECIELERLAKVEPYHKNLNDLSRYNTGTDTVVLVSGANGYGEYCEDTADINIGIGRILKLKLALKEQKEPEFVINATKSDFESGIRNKNIANMYLLGHGSYHSWVATDGAIDWYDAANMVGDHLKNGIFANLGCGGMQSWNYIPLGKFVVGSMGTLIGKRKELAWAHEAVDIANFEVLPK